SNNPALTRLCEMGREPERTPFLEKLFTFMQNRGTPITSLPSICKQVIDLFSLYFLVKEMGGMDELNKSKKWRDISSNMGLGSSSSAGFTLKKNYAKYLYPFECKFDRGDIDPLPFLSSLDSLGGLAKRDASAFASSKKGLSDKPNVDTNGECVSFFWRKNFIENVFLQLIRIA
ncbi:hypothetical protein HELRODRAFT_76486, partial [Helobdella robusta]|uniref:ARID domain-containing protein n=1 Tax=Helobdella robusta TaxID=6412 RepID=T1G2K5_HELRO